MTQRDLTNGAAWMDGKIIPTAEAAIPVTDWGFTHSDVAYDVATVWDGAFFRLDDYVARFLASCATFRLDPGKSAQEIADILHDIVAASGLRDSYVAVVCTRGKPRVRGSRDPRDCENRFFAWCVPRVYIIQPEVLATGASLWIARETRRIPDAAVNQRAKNYHWADLTAGMFEAKDQGRESVILLDINGNVAEGPGFNVFWVRDGVIYTPERHVLHGMTRRTVLEIADELGIRAETGDFPPEALLQADEAFITSSGGGPLWIAQIDDRIYANRATGPITAALHDRYRAWRADRADMRRVIDYAAHA